MADVSKGPVGTLPGTKSRRPEHIDSFMCDTHSDRKAVVRIQGETDSFGCEYMHACKECEEAHDRHEPEESICEWCSKRAITHAFRDPEEGSHGPVYYVCDKCRTDHMKYIREAFCDDNED